MIVKTCSWLSFFSAIVGMIFLYANEMIETFKESYYDLFVFIGSLLLFLGMSLGFVAAFRREKGKVKYIGIGVFFIMLLAVCVIDPFRIIRLAMWMKNS